MRRLPTADELACRLSRKKLQPDRIASREPKQRPMQAAGAYRFLIREKVTQRRLEQDRARNPRYRVQPARRQRAILVRATRHRLVQIRI